MATFELTDLSFVTSTSLSRFSFDERLETMRRLCTEEDNAETRSIFTKHLAGTDLTFLEAKRLEEMYEKWSNARERSYINPHTNRSWRELQQRIVDGDDDLLLLVSKLPSRRSFAQQTFKEAGMAFGISGVPANKIRLDDGLIVRDRNLTTNRNTKTDVDFVAVKSQYLNESFDRLMVEMLISHKYSIGKKNHEAEGGGSQSNNIQFQQKYIRNAAMACDNPANDGVAFAVICDGAYGLTWLPELNNYIGEKFGKHKDRIFAMSSDVLWTRLYTSVHG